MMQKTYTHAMGPGEKRTRANTNVSQQCCLAGSKLHSCDYGKYFMENELVVSTYIHSHILTLNAIPRQWVALDTAILKSLWSKMLTSVSPFFSMSLLMVSIYLSFGLPLGRTPSTSMSCTGYHLHVHTSVVASAPGVLLSAELLPLP